jgi:hypothetical protein
VVLVDEARPNQGRGEAGAPDGQVLARLPLELGRHLDRVAVGEGGVALDAVERVRKHDLRQLLPDPGELALVLRRRRLLLPRLPEQHHLVQPPSQQMRAELLGSLVVEPVQLLVRRPPVDLTVRTGGEAVERDAHVVDQLPQADPQLLTAAPDQSGRGLIPAANS